MSARDPRPAVAVGIMDRDSWAARTDNIVVADPRRRRLTWVPRDLWSVTVGDRVNEAFGRGGHELFQAALGELGLPVGGSVVLLRSAVEGALRDLEITVPVERTSRYWYPLTPTARLEDGAKLVEFAAPRETLAGERIHQWIGARRSADTPPPRLPDLDRIRRQQVFLRRLLEDGFDFRQLVDDPTLVAISSPSGLGALAAVHAGWALRTLDWVEPVTIAGKMVLRRRRPAWLRWMRRAEA